MTNTVKVTNFCRNGQCSKCGQCCAEFLPLTKDEVNLMKAYVKERKIELTDWLNVDGEKFTLGSLCPFLDKETRTCKIYEVRPKICRTFKCNKDSSILESQKANAHDRAHYNKARKSSKNKNSVSNIYSTYELITGDIKRTIDLTIADLMTTSNLEFVDLRVLSSLLNYLGREEISDVNYIKNLMKGDIVYETYVKESSN